MKTRDKLTLYSKKLNDLANQVKSYEEKREQILEPFQDELSKLQESFDKQYQKITAPAQEALAELQADNLKEQETLNSDIKILKSEITAEVLKVKETIKGEEGTHMAVYTPEQQSPDKELFRNLLLFTEDDLVKKQLLKCVKTDNAKVSIRPL